MRSLFHIIYILFFILSGRLVSQTTGNSSVSITLPIVTLMDIEPSGNIGLSFSAPTEAGRPIINPSANTTKWINYTSAILSGGALRRITASVNQIIPGVDIKLQASSASGVGGGTLGTPSGQVILTTTANTIINGIGGAFTGNGANNGHRLTISLALNTYENLLVHTSTPIVITYTITE